jgi:hypothetical protein
MPQPIFIKLGIGIMVPEPISNGVLYKSLHSFYTCVPLVADRIRSDKSVTAASNAQATIDVVGRLVSYATRVVSYESKRLFLPRTFCSIYNNSGTLEAKAVAYSELWNKDFTTQKAPRVHIPK